MPDLTPDEIARAKRWAAMQTPPVTVVYDEEEKHWWYWGLPDFLNFGFGCGCAVPFETESDAWDNLVAIVGNLFKSIGPVIREECAAVCDEFEAKEPMGCCSDMAEAIAIELRAMK